MLTGEKHATGSTSTTQCSTLNKARTSYKHSQRCRDCSITSTGPAKQQQSIHDEKRKPVLIEDEIRVENVVMNKTKHYWENLSKFQKVLKQKINNIWRDVDIV